MRYVLNRRDGNSWPTSTEHSRSLELAIEAIRRRRDGKIRGRINLEDASVISEIPSTHHAIKAADGEFHIVWTLKDHDSDVCNYEFRPHDPIGWVMMNGKRSADRFAGDATSSVSIF